MNKLPIEMIRLSMDSETEPFPAAVRLWVQNFESEPVDSHTDEDGDTFARGLISGYPAVVSRVDDTLNVTFVGALEGNIVDDEIAFLDHVEGVRMTALRLAHALNLKYHPKSIQFSVIATQTAEAHLDTDPVLRGQLLGIDLPRLLIEADLEFDVSFMSDVDDEALNVITARWRNGLRVVSKKDDETKRPAVGATVSAECLNFGDLDQNNSEVLLEELMNKAFHVYENGYASL